MWNVGSYTDTDVKSIKKADNNNKSGHFIDLI